MCALLLNAKIQICFYTFVKYRSIVAFFHELFILYIPKLKDFRQTFRAQKKYELFCKKKSFLPFAEKMKFCTFALKKNIFYTEAL